jgi:hypothetical protein
MEVGLEELHAGEVMSEALLYPKSRAHSRQEENIYLRYSRLAHEMRRQLPVVLFDADPPRVRKETCHWILPEDPDANGKKEFSPTSFVHPLDSMLGSPLLWGTFWAYMKAINGSAKSLPCRCLRQGFLAFSWNT